MGYWPATCDNDLGIKFNSFSLFDSRLRPMIASKWGSTLGNDIIQSQLNHPPEAIAREMLDSIKHDGFVPLQCDINVGRHYHIWTVRTIIFPLFNSIFHPISLLFNIYIRVVLFHLLKLFSLQIMENQNLRPGLLCSKSCL